MDNKNKETDGKNKEVILPYDLPTKPVSHYWYLTETIEAEKTKSWSYWSWFDSEKRERQKLISKILMRHKEILTRDE